MNSIESSRALCSMHSSPSRFCSIEICSKLPSARALARLAIRSSIRLSKSQRWLSSCLTSHTTLRFVRSYVRFARSYEWSSPEGCGCSAVTATPRLVHRVVDAGGLRRKQCITGYSTVAPGMCGISIDVRGM